MATHNTSQFRKGLKVQLDGDPYLMIECNFVKPGKGQALYKCKLRNLIRNTVIDRTMTLRYKQVGFDLSGILEMIETILDEDDPTPTRAETWGGVKALFR